LTKWRLITFVTILTATGLLVAGAGGGPANAGTATAPASNTSATEAASKPSIVLVHGAWADSGSWDAVVRRLQGMGYTIYVPPNPLRGLSNDSGTIADFLSTIPGPIVLVGHSYGGAVITNAATGNTNVKALVYVDAFIPAAGEVVSQLITDPSSCLAVPDLSTVLDFVPFPWRPCRRVRRIREAEPVPRLLRERPRSCARRGPRGDPATLVDGCFRRTVWRAGVGDPLVVGRGRDP
jgi:pimeloyl-ACP methyl ester carboxylesterase